MTVQKQTKSVYDNSGYVHLIREIARFSAAGYNFIKSVIFQRSVNRVAAYFTAKRGRKRARLSHANRLK